MTQKSGPASLGRRGCCTALVQVVSRCFAGHTDILLLGCHEVFISYAFSWGVGLFDRLKPDQAAGGLPVLPCVQQGDVFDIDVRGRGPRVAVDQPG